MDIYSNQPYLYVIGWTNLNKWYIGCRYAKGCHPGDLWVSYFTSSEVVREYRANYGEPDHKEILLIGDILMVYRSEQSIISDFKLTHDPEWLNQRSAHLSKGEYWRCLTPESRERAKQNMRKPRSEKGRLGHKKAAQRRRKLSDVQIEQIKLDSRPCRFIAIDYAVSAETIHKIKRKLTTS